jgi:hypothetical protein
MDERSSNDSSDSSIRSESQRIFKVVFTYFVVYFFNCVFQFKRLDVNGDGHLTFIDDGFGDIIEQVDENSTDAALLSSYNGYMRVSVAFAQWFSSMLKPFLIASAS